MMYILSSICLLTVIAIVHEAHSLNVLFFGPSFAASHNNFYRNIADTLTDAGFNVTYLRPIYDEQTRNKFPLQKTKNIITFESNTTEKNGLGHLSYIWEMTNDVISAKKGMHPIVDMLKVGCKQFLINKNLIDSLKQQQFDVGIMEPFHICGMALFEYLGIEKTVQIVTTVQMDHILDYIGEPKHMSYVPALCANVSDEMNIFDRYENMQQEDAFSSLIIDLFDEEMEIYRELLDPNMRHWKELLASASLVFTNSNPYLDFVRPTIQKTIQIGGITTHLEEAKSQKLNPEIDSFLAKDKKCVLISFGSIAQSYQMPSDWRSSILNTIKSMPNIVFIWKYESDDLSWARGVSNVLFVKWVPQSRLLVDDRVTAFITHSGLSSSNELAYSGKPAILVPLFADQMRNARMIERHGGAITFNKFELKNTALLQKNLNEILNNPSFSQNAQRLAAMLSNQPFKPKETLIKHVEFVAKYGPLKQLDSKARHLNFIQLHQLDIYALIGLSYSVILYAVYWIVTKIQLYVRSSKKSV